MEVHLGLDHGGNGLSQFPGRGEFPVFQNPVPDMAVELGIAAGFCETVVITSPTDAVKFPEPEISVNYPRSISDKRLLWIDVENYRDFKRSGDYEFMIDFLNPVQFNTYEQDEGAINGWQKYSRCNFISATNSYKTIYSITRVFYTTRENMETYKPKAGDVIIFKLIVRNKSTGESKDYIFVEELKIPYEIEKYIE